MLVVKISQAICLTALLTSLISRIQFERLGESETTCTLPTTSALPASAEVYNQLAVWFLLTVVCMFLVNHMSMDYNRSASARWANVLFVGVFLHNLFVIATVYLKWTVHFSPPMQTLQLFPTIFFNLHSYFQIHYILRPRKYQTEDAFFRCISFFFNLIMLVHFSMFQNNYCLIFDEEYSTIQTLLKATFAMAVILHRLIALVNFSDVIFQHLMVVQNEGVIEVLPPARKLDISHQNGQVLIDEQIMYTESLHCLSDQIRSYRSEEGDESDVMSYLSDDIKVSKKNNLSIIVTGITIPSQYNVVDSDGKEQLAIIVAS